MPFGLCSLLCVGCATVPYQGPPVVEIPKPIGGIYHEVQKGDTLWRIAKTYGIEIADIVRANNISDETKINHGQKILIPGAKIPMPVTTEKNKLYEKDYFSWPIDGEILYYFGQKIYGARNKGIDIRAHNEERVLASKSGRVVFCSEHFKGYGNIIVIDHLDGFFSIYSRNSQNLVKAGDSVAQNQAIALTGSTGRGEAASLHFEIRREGRPQNPLHYLP